MPFDYHDGAPVTAWRTWTLLNETLPSSLLVSLCGREYPVRAAHLRRIYHRDFFDKAMKVKWGARCRLPSRPFSNISLVPMGPFFQNVPLGFSDNYSKCVFLVTLWCHRPGELRLPLDSSCESLTYDKQERTSFSLLIVLLIWNSPFPVIILPIYLNVLAEFANITTWFVPRRVQRTALHLIWVSPY